MGSSSLDITSLSYPLVDNASYLLIMVDMAAIDSVIRSDMGNNTTMSVKPEVMEKLRKVHRIRQDNPKQIAYYNTVDQLCDLYINSILEQRDESAEVTGQ